MSKPQFLTYDTLDDRREIYTLLGKLRPIQAVAWLSRLCKKATVHGVHPGPSRSMWQRAEQAERKGGELARRLVNEIYGDLWMLSSQHGLDIDESVRMLEKMVKRPTI